VERIGDLVYRTFERVLDLVAQMGLPLAIAAWGSVFVASVGLALVLRRHSLRGRVRAPLLVAALSLVAHLADYLVTLRMSPDLSLEMNPIWRVVADTMGLAVAKWYGLTGKLLLAVLSFECFALYLVQREALFPREASGFLSFCRELGRTDGRSRAVRLANLRVFFLYLFALVHPICLYIAFLNGLVDRPAFDRMPSVPAVLVLYLLALTALYFLSNYRLFRARGGGVPAGVLP